MLKIGGVEFAQVSAELKKCTSQVNFVAWAMPTISFHKGGARYQFVYAVQSDCNQDFELK